MKTTMLLRSAALLLAFLPLGAHSQQPAASDPARQAEATQRAIAALPPQCTLGAPGAEVPGAGAHGSWLITSKAAPGDGQGPGIVNVYSFDKPVRARALRVALDQLALKTLEKAETLDAQGNWQDAGPVAGRKAPTGCSYVWLVQALPQGHQVAALRFTFRREIGTITSANPGVLPETTAR